MVTLYWTKLCTYSTRPTGFIQCPVYTKNGDFKQIILNTAYLKTLEIILAARESLSIKTFSSIIEV